jgi:hypothetical protein
MEPSSFAPFLLSVLETLAEQELFGLVACQCKCPQLGCVGLFASAQFQQEFSANGVEEMISLQITRERFDLGQRSFWPSTTCCCA